MFHLFFLSTHVLDNDYKKSFFYNYSYNLSDILFELRCYFFYIFIDLYFNY